MRYAFMTAVAVLALSVTAHAGDLPEQFSYTIYVEGKDVGKSSTNVTESADSYLFKSTTTLTFGGFSLDLQSTTEVDKETFLPVRFTYEGAKRQTIVDGETTIEGNEATCITGEHGDRYTATRSSELPQVLLFEDYVMAHEVIIARAFWNTGSESAQFGVLFPSIARMTTAAVARSSELSFESETKETYCVKLVVALQGGSPYASYYDPERGLPVYLAFPATSTEAFLDEFFEGKPVSRYRAR